ncbi:MAG: adenosine kinase, partial [Chthonomonadales bacterium]
PVVIIPFPGRVFFVPKETHEMPYDVFGMCNALYDIQAETPASMLVELGVVKGSMTLIDHEQQAKMVAAVYSHLVNTEPGGSGCNTMIGIGQLGGTATYTSRVGSDEHGRMYREKMAQLGIKPNLGEEDGATGICLVLVSPDAQRTLCTYLGLSRSLQPEDVNIEDIKNSKYIYVTGYLWDTDNQKEAVLLAMREANKAGTKVSLSLSDPFCVNRHKEDFSRIVKEHVDLVFGNKDEAMALTDTDNPLDALRVLAEQCEIAVVTLDDKGSLIRSGDKVYEIPVFPVKAIDTTGAGDMYAAGLLYGVTHNLPLDKTGRLASYCAAQVVAKMGPRLEGIDPKAIEVVLA